jgi:hypothetical protein
MSNLTNFRSDYMNKPRFWNHPLGMWFGKFRNFMLHSFNFVGDNVIKPALRGDGTPLATIALLGAPAGIAVNELKEVIRNDNTELSWTQHYLEGLMSMGLLGLWGDGLNQAITHPKNMADFLIGSVYTDAFDTMNAAAGLLTPTPEEIQNAGKDLLESWGVTKNLSGPVTRALGTENPLSNRGERQQEESRLELGLSPFPSL